MRQFTIFATLVCLMMASGSTANAFRRIEEGQLLPDVTLQTLDGQPSRLGENRGGKATVVIFWADWAPRSAEVLKDMAALHKSLGGKGLSVWAVNVEHQEWDPALLPTLRKAVEVAGADYPVVVDKGLEYYNQLGVTAVPSLLLLGPNGVVTKLMPGYSTMGKEEFRETVQNAVEPPPVSATETKAVRAYAPKGLAERYLRMAIMLWEKGQKKKAQDYVNKSIAEDPGYPDANLAMADILEDGGDLEGARKIRERFPETEPAKLPEPPKLPEMPKPPAVSK